MSTSPPALDPITLEVLHNSLRSIADESYIALMKSAYSTNIKERRDHSTGLMDARGNTVVQAEHTQAVHLSSMLGNVEAILDAYDASDMAEGDIFISNDPYAAKGSHLPDVNFAMPVFVDGELLAFSCNIAHHADIGGMSPGSMSSSMTEIYQEGVRMPVVRLFRGGELVNDVFDLILLNVRLPEERRGDYFAQVAACRLGEQRLKALARANGVGALKATFQEVMARTEMRLRRAVKTIPDGEYAFEDRMDDDGGDARDIPIKLKVTVAGDRLAFDFTGTAPQVRGNINCPLNATVASVCYTVKALLDPDVANNQGLINAVDVTAEPGTLVHSTFPAAVAYRSHTTQRIIDVVMGAMAQVLPEAVLAASNGSNTTAIFSGVDPRTDKPYLYLETYGGGCGARSFKDGKDGVQQHIANTANLPVEAIEKEYPLIVEEYSLASDTGGAGKYRGGLALKRVIRPLDHSCLFTGAGERFRNPPWGLFGGRAGAIGRFMQVEDGGHETLLPTKPAPMACGPHQKIVIQSPGAGGYGDPAGRDPARLAVDWHSGKFSQAYMADGYGLDRNALDTLPRDEDALDYVED
ncbi:MAG: hydantoinase B/oxoprolinase family protein [Rhodospirillales bacterium]|jgi:N-methylhydantoinase B|nr:hydantoinase B/oxoprolinase family protein [Rhodospirillales bacterium]